jgi:Uma2 family endonuclease
MMMATGILLTTEELLAMPSDGVDRWLINGELRERRMTVRNRFYSAVMTRVAQYLANWLDTRPGPRGRILSGDAGVRLRNDPDTTFGVDVIYVSADVLSRQRDDSTIIEGVPELAVEILSPNDTLQDTEEKIDAYLSAGVPLVWIVNTHRRTVTVHRPNAGPELVNEHQELVGAPHLPGFQVPVRQLFE